MPSYGSAKVCSESRGRRGSSGANRYGEPGEHVVVPEKTPLANLWLTLLQGAGVKTDKHGDSTGVVKDLRA